MSKLRYILRKTKYRLKEIPYLLQIIFYKKRNTTISNDSAWKILKDAGYEKKEIFENIPPLMNSSIDLSIIVPVYNSEKYLSKCLLSLLNQETKYKYEVICINDGSNDSSLDIIKTLSLKYDNLIFESQENCGISATRNAGIIKARGEFIGFVDNDDYVTKNYVELILNAGYKNNADIVQTGHDIVFPNGKLKERRTCGDYILDRNNVDEIIKYTKGYIWGGCLRKKLFNKLRFPSGFWYEDMVTSLLLVQKATKIVIINSPLYKYLWHGGNASKNLWKTSSIKSIDQFWLAYQCAEYSRNILKLPVDDVFVTFLIREWSTVLINRTSLLDESIHKAMFSLAASYINNLTYTYNPKNFYMRKIYDSYKTGNFSLWKKASIAMSFHNA